MTLMIEMGSVGGPEVLTMVDRDLPAPGPGQVQIKQSAIGVNFLDTYHRTGLYPLPRLPAVLGVEGAGVVIAVGEDVDDVQIGDRVAYAAVPPAGYAEARNLPASRAVKIPSDVPEAVAGSALLKGLTAHMLLHRTYPVVPGSFILVHAAAGGLGQFLTRWAKRLGAIVIATVGSERKVALARAAGADIVFLHGAGTWAAEAKAFADGVGVHVAFDGIGGTMLARTFEVVRPFGLVASLGQSAGAIPPVGVDQLGPVRCIALARPSVIAYMSDPVRYRASCIALFDFLRDANLQLPRTEYALRDAGRAHADLEAGLTTGSVALIP